MGRILVLYDSLTDCTLQMAHLVAEGAQAVEGMEVKVRHVSAADAPQLVHWAQGLAVGTPTNLGGISWQMKKFWDDWAAENWSKVDGKLACSFSSQGGHAGGAELASMSMNHVLMNFGFLVFGVTDYVSPIHTLHYGATCAKMPRDEVAQLACKRLGLRLAEWVAVFFEGRQDLHPLQTTKAKDRETEAAAANIKLGKRAEKLAALRKTRESPVHLVVTIRVPKVTRADWRALVGEMVASTRKEKGCIHYHFCEAVGEAAEGGDAASASSAPADGGAASTAPDASMYRVIEVWESQEALDRHWKSQHFVRLIPQLDKVSKVLTVQRSLPVVPLPDDHAIASTGAELNAGSSCSNLVLDLDASDAAAVEAAASELIGAAEQAPGCAYASVTAVQVDDAAAASATKPFQHISVWRSQAALDAFVASPAGAALIERLGKLGTVSRNTVATSLDNEERAPAVLIFNKATEYKHESIPDASATLVKLCNKHGWLATCTNDSTVFHATTGRLDHYQAIVFVSNSGDMLSPDEKKGLEAYVNSGRGGIFGVHSAIAAFLDIVDHAGKTEAKGTYEFFGHLMGAYFTSHPPVQEATIKVDVDAAARVGLELPATYKQTDEWYNLDRDLVAKAAENAQSSGVTVLARVDRTTYEGGPADTDLPVIWHQRFGPKKVPVFVSTLGHLPEAYSLESTEAILLAGLRFALSHI